MNSGEGTTQHSLDPYLTRLGIWAFSIGTSIGWGSFIVTCNTYLLCLTGHAGSGLTERCMKTRGI